MKKLQSCEPDNCIPISSSCVKWNGGDIEYLGICNEETLNTLLWEIITKLEAITGEDLASFDIDSLIAVCNKKAPLEISILSILNLLKDNDICLKDYILTLEEKINEIAKDTNVNVSLKCLADFDNLGNALSLTRDQLDQLVIDTLCNHKGRIETLESKVIDLQSQIDGIDASSTVDELEFGTCVNGSILPTSTQVINVATSLCELKDETGTGAEIVSALSNTPSIFTTPEYMSLTGWIASPSNLADNYNNLLIAFNYMIGRVDAIEDGCCAPSCEKVKLGISAVYNEDNTAIIIKFTAGAGTNIPSGFVDIGSTIVITDIDGNTETFTTSGVDLIANNAEIEVSISGLNLTGDLTISIDANMSNGTLTCSKCLGKTVKRATCNFCEICAEGEEGSSVVIVYEDNGGSKAYQSFNPQTTTSTTTTTTIAP